MHNCRPDGRSAVAAAVRNDAPDRASGARVPTCRRTCLEGAGGRIGP